MPFSSAVLQKKSTRRLIKTVFLLVVFITFMGIIVLYNRESVCSFYLLLVTFLSPDCHPQNHQGFYLRETSFFCLLPCLHLNPNQNSKLEKSCPLLLNN
ncbi:hypothetical protein CEXT_732261 [Caerostris extrusa]|uniref:Uncharacterized protein n=1 Tax=Caerostris extrusa TaxID=172846 RepID=A0AAV4Y3H3_CAEEX|nr:hypothetical protein CEXT_732261 [Caerostris extrusa]